MDYKRTKLDNGINVVAMKGLSSQAVTISAYIKAGCRFDPFNKPGIAHFTEHMAFSKTKSFQNSQVLARAVEQFGGWHWAFTWIDHQKHMVHLPKVHFEMGVKVLFETVFNLVIEDQEVEKEKGVVKEEILRNRSDPSKAIWDYVWFPLFFQGTNLARPYSGVSEDIDTIISQDVKSFISQNFNPEDLVIFVAGDIEQTEIDKVMKSYFGKIKSKNIKNNRNIPSLASKQKNRTFALRDENYYQSSIVVGIKTVPYVSKKKYILEVIKEMIGGYSGTTLLYKLRQEGGLIYTWKVFQDNLVDTGYLVINVSVAHENLTLVIKIILEEFKRLSKGNFSQEEVEIAKRHLTGSLLSNIERGRDYINLYALQELLDPENFKNLSELVETYQSVSTEDIKSIASEFMKEDSIFIGAIGNVNSKDLSALL